MAKATEATVAENTATTPEATPAAEQAAPAAQSFVKPAPQVSTVIAVPFAGDPNAQHATQAVTEETGKDKPEGKYLTQADIDAIVKNRLDRALEKFKDYDELKAKATAADEAQQTEAQKTAARLAELEQNAAKLAQERAQLLVEVSFKDAASEIGLPSDAAYKLADMAQAKYDEQGRITNAKELAAAVAQQYPGLVKRGASASVVNPGRGNEQATQAETEAQKRARLLAPQGGSFWGSGGVVLPAALRTGE